MALADLDARLSTWLQSKEGGGGGGGVGELTEIQLNANRTRAQLIMQTHGVAKVLEEYLSEVCDNIIKVYDDYGLSIEDEIKVAIQKRPRQAGRVSVEHIRDYRNNGNLRTKMCFILDVSLGTQRFLWHIMKAAKVRGAGRPASMPMASNEDLRVYEQRIYNMLGLNYLLLEGFVNPRCNPSTRYDDPVFYSYRIISRDRKGCVERPAAERGSRLMPVEKIRYLPLSQPELDYMQRSAEDTSPLPWETGFMKWKADPASEYAEVAREYNQVMISGKAVYADMCLEVMSHVREWPGGLLGTLCCVVWLCGTDENSAWEVLLVSNLFSPPIRCDSDKTVGEHIDRLVGRVQLY